MNHPKLKHPGLCRILPYLIVIGTFLLPAVLVLCLTVPDIIKVVTLLGSLLALLVYIVRNMMVLMALDTTLALLSCHQTGRKQYTLPKNRTAEAIRRSILRFGIPCDPTPFSPQPAALRYQFRHSMTVYAGGIEKVVAAYEVDHLNSDTYRGILHSAKANAKVLTGRKKARFLDSSQKNAPLHRVTVVLILAHSVEQQLAENLYSLVCKSCGDEEKDCTLPCVLDLSKNTCTFNCLRVPYIGFSYAVKNRGIRLIKNRIFGGNWNLAGNTAHIHSDDSILLEDSLWDLWKHYHHQLIGAERQSKRRFEAMSEKEIICQKDALYLKWDHRGLCQSIKLDSEAKTVQIEQVVHWYYPKLQPIGKKTILAITQHILSHFENSGYTAEFVSIDDLS